MEPQVTLVVAFVAGLLTFLSPCILPLIPSFIAYITGVSFKDLKAEKMREEVRVKTLSHTLLFIAGFSVVFILLGLTATAIGRALFNFQGIIRIAGGALIIFFGLYLLGVIKLDFMTKDHHMKVRNGSTYVGSFLVGITFAAAWTPCAGPILGSILVMAGTESSVTRGALLLCSYSAGVAILFIITALTINHFLAVFTKFTKFVGYINKVGGVFLIIVGILMATNYMQVIGERLLMMMGQ